MAIDAALARARIKHAFGGALALAYYAEPRATIDIDLNVFAGPERVGDVRRALEPLGIQPADGPEVVAADGQCRWWWEETPVDLFFAYDPFHDAMGAAIRRVPLGDDRIPILGPEHLTVCKAVFDRPKDWIDIEQILVSNPSLDNDDVRSWLGRLVGVDDPRTQRFEALAARA